MNSLRWNLIAGSVRARVRMQERGCSAAVYWTSFPPILMCCSAGGLGSIAKRTP